MTATPGSHRQHGTYARYVQGPNEDDVAGRGCRCEACRAANRNYERARKRRAEPAYVTATTARRHVQWLSEQGVGLKQVALSSGLSHGAVSKLVYGRDGRPSKRIRRETHDRIMAVTPSDGAGGSYIPAGPTWDIVDQLVSNGWTKVAIARALGQTGPGLQLSRNKVTRRNAAAVRALLDQPVPPTMTRWGPRQPDHEPDHDPPATQPGPNPADSFLLKVVAILEDRIDQAHWRRRAACITQPRWMFFPTDGDDETARAAKAVCATCPVADECLQAHLDDDYGIFGGTTPGERSRRRRITAA